MNGRAADEKVAEASPAARPHAGATQTSSEQNSSPLKLSAPPGRTETAARSDGSTGSLDPASYPANGRTSPRYTALEKEPSLDTALGLVAQSRTNLVALESQPPMTAFLAAASQLRADSPSLPAAALAGASRDLGVRRALPGSHSAPAITPTFSPRVGAADPHLRPASRNSGAQGGDSGAVPGSWRQPHMEATLFPDPEPTPEPAAPSNGAQTPEPAADMPLWKRIEAAERAAAAAADRAEAEAAGLVPSRDREAQRHPGGGAGEPKHAAAVRRVTGGTRAIAISSSTAENAAAALKQVTRQLG